MALESMFESTGENTMETEKMAKWTGMGPSLELMTKLTKVF